MAPPGGDEQYDALIVDIVGYVYEYDPSADTATLDIARTALLDSLGCAAETISSPSCPWSLLGPTVPGATLANGARVPGTAFELDPVTAAFNTSILIRYLDHNDGLTGREWGHPSDNLGALLATIDYTARNPAQRGEGAPPPTLATLLAALIKAYEVQGVLQMENSFNAIGIDHVILVKVASAAVTSWLLGLSRREACAAVSHAWLDGHALRTYRHAPNAGPRKGWAGADAASRGLRLALLARAGQPGAPSVLTAPRWGVEATLMRGQPPIVRARPFGAWAMRHLFFKLVPAEAHSLAALEAVLTLAATARAQGRQIPDDVARVAVRTHAGAALIIDKRGPLRNAADRDHCLQYILAVGLAKGAPPAYADYADASPYASSAEVDRLRSCVLVTEDPAFSAAYLDPDIRSLASGVSLAFADGSATPEAVVEFPLGNPKNAGTRAAVREKVARHLALVYEPPAVARLLDVVRRADASVPLDLMPALWPVQHAAQPCKM